MSKSMPEDAGYTTLVAELAASGVTLVEVPDLREVACWVKSQQVLLVRTGIDADEWARLATWAKSFERFPEPTDIPTPDWSAGCYGWTYLHNDDVWGRQAYRFFGKHVEMYEHQKVDRDGALSSTGVKVDINVDSASKPSQLRKLAAELLEAADALTAARASTTQAA